MYFVLRPDESRGTGNFIYCSGVDLYSFLPITKGRHRPMSNPAMRGLQLVNLDVRALTLSKGATPKAVQGNHCSGIVPSKDGWYKELLLIENAPASLPDEIISHCVVNLMKKIFKAMCLMDVNLPDKLLAPDELETFIDSLCTEYGSQPG